MTEPQPDQTGDDTDEPEFSDDRVAEMNDLNARADLVPETGPPPDPGDDAEAAQ